MVSSCKAKLVVNKWTFVSKRRYDHKWISFSIIIRRWSFLQEDVVRLQEELCERSCVYLQDDGPTNGSSQIMYILCQSRMSV
jgi:hypothetical protein